MTHQSFSIDPQSLTHELLQQLIGEWTQTLNAARNSLFAQEWEDAVAQYWRTYPMAERLLKESTCKNCAIKRYTRTLAELTYVMRKNEQHEKILAFIELTKPTLNTELPSELVQELITIMTDIAIAPIQEVDAWINGLFAMDESMNHRIH